MPVSVRETSKRETGANKVSALFTRLGTDIEDPLERLEEHAQRNRNAKDHHKAISADSLQDWAEFAAPRTFGLAVRAYAGLRLAEKHPVVHNLVISNVPGPPHPALLHGRARSRPCTRSARSSTARASTSPSCPTTAGCASAIIACRESMPDVDDLAQRFPAELEQLREAVQGRQAVTPITKAKSKTAKA